MSDWTVHLTCTEDGSRKFWRGRVVGTELHVNYGRIGSDGQTSVKGYGSSDEAAAELDKQARSKRKKGYVDAEGGGEPAPEPPPPAVEEGPKQIALSLDLEGQRMDVSLAVEGATIRTTVVERYADEASTAAAFQRLVQAMLAEGYQRVK